MDNNTLQRLKDTIDKSQSIGVAVGKNPSLDEMASALALFLIFKNMQKQVSVASPTEPIVALSSLVGIDRVQGSLGGEGGDLTVAFPYKEGEIEKVSYTIENSRLNIIVKAGQDGLSFSEKDVEYIRGGGSLNVLFIIGAGRLSDLGNVYNSDATQETTIVNIDNDATNERFGDIVLVSDQFTSLCEQVADLVMTLGFRIDVDTAQNLLDGIIDATDNFRQSDASSLAFEMAGILMRAGASRERAVVASGGTPAERQPQNSGKQMQMPRHSMQENKRQVQPEPKPEPAPVSKQDEVRQEINQLSQSQAKQEEPPSDWLTPKVYKGSSNF